MYASSSRSLRPAAKKVGKKGVVRDPATHREVLKMAEGYAMANHFTPAGLDFSPIKAPRGQH